MAEEIINKVVERIARAGFDAASHIAYSKKVTGIFAHVAGQPMHYQHLLSARKARDALKDYPNGSLPGDVLKVVLSCLNSHLRIAGAALLSSS